MRIGIGYDLHRLAPNRRLMVGGIHIPFEKGLVGHSDADVLVHAIADAILGASGNKDIGQLFPDTDSRNKDLPGEVLLRDVVRIARESGYCINNVDSVLIAEQPKFGPHVLSIRNRLAELLQTSPTNVNIKAKTAEGTGEIGAGGAIAAYAVVLLSDCPS
jgi:2-C-methyl-D-erythritol 2,4-cyclodiphosphate synthase